ncbi:MAG: hypothetical protein RL699_1095 [Bacteroidota bacterium]|jgi:hypothetical protein
MHKLKYLAFFLLIIACSKDEAPVPPVVVEPIGEQFIQPSAFAYNNSFPKGLLCVNDTVFGMCNAQQDYHQEGVGVFKINRQLAVLQQLFPLGNFLNEWNYMDRFFETSDHNIIVLNNYSNNSGSYFGYCRMIKMTPKLEVLWTKEMPSGIWFTGLAEYNGTFYLSGCDAVATSINGTAPADWLENKSVFFTTDLAGNWQDFRYLAPINNRSNDIISLGDGTFIVSSVRLNKIQDSVQDIMPYLLRIDANGQVIWELQIDSFHDFVFLAEHFFIKKTTSAIVAAYRNRDGGNHTLAKIKFDGTLLWKKRIEYEGRGIFGLLESFCMDAEENIYLTGTDNQFGVQTYQMQLAKYSATGTLLKQYNHIKQNQWPMGIAINSFNELFVVTTNYPESNRLSMYKFNREFEVQ